jgi:hypothetical protein
MFPLPIPLLNLAAVSAEPAIKHEFNWSTQQWTAKNITVSLSSHPFDEGTMRKAYKLTDHSLPAGRQECVAKVSKEVFEGRQTYFDEVVMQYRCKDLAAKFNQSGPPKPIDFLDAWVIEFTNRRAGSGMDNLVALVEPYLNGRYTKHSNNYGFVSPENRNTPAAFSHWTFCATGGQLLVCDIQGVDDMYTDPQIHSCTGGVYGKGDLGMDGIRQFFATHRCNAVCRQLNLPCCSGQPPSDLGKLESGTAAPPPMPHWESPVMAAGLFPLSTGLVPLNTGLVPISTTPAVSPRSPLSEPVSPASSLGALSFNSLGYSDSFSPVYVETPSPVFSDTPSPVYTDISNPVFPTGPAAPLGSIRPLPIMHPLLMVMD